jgi:hypothetical protein
VLKWERRVQDAFENRGIAKVEQIATRWALTVMCGGTHSTYLDDTTIDLARYARGYVSARYTWVVRTVTDPKCPKAPCGPFTERRIALERLTPVVVTEEQARQMALECTVPGRPRTQDPGPRTQDPGLRTEDRGLT